MVGQAAGLAPGQRVLSVACGRGEELQLWVEAFGVSWALGLDIDADAVAAAQQRSKSLSHGHGPDAGRWHCRRADLSTVADEVSRGARTDGAPATGPAAFDAVVCVDAAYHLAPRARFLADATRALRPGGRLAFTDLVARHDGLRGGTLRRLADRAGLQGRDWIAPADWPARLHDAGLTLQALQPLEGPVLDGFARFARAQQRRLGPLARDPAWARVRATARLIPVARRLGLGCVLVVARRGG